MEHQVALEGLRDAHAWLARGARRRATRRAGARRSGRARPVGHDRAVGARGAAQRAAGDRRLLGAVVPAVPPGVADRRDDRGDAHVVVQGREGEHRRRAEARAGVRRAEHPDDRPVPQRPARARVARRSSRVPRSKPSSGCSSSPDPDGVARLVRARDLGARRFDGFGDVAMVAAIASAIDDAGGLQLVAHRRVAQRVADRGEARVERVAELAQRVVHLLAVVGARTPRWRRTGPSSAARARAKRSPTSSHFSLASAMSALLMLSATVIRGPGRGRRRSTPIAAAASVPRSRHPSKRRSARSAATDEQQAARGLRVGQEELLGLGEIAEVDVVGHERVVPLGSARDHARRDQVADAVDHRHRRPRRRPRRRPMPTHSSRRCPSRPNPVTSVAACTPTATRRVARARR